MEAPQKSVLLFVFLLIIQGWCFGQDTPGQNTEETPKMWVVVKNDGSSYVGKIIDQDAREVLLESIEIGLVYIPRHEIREIREVMPGEIRTGGGYMPAEVFSTRYFLTTNGLPVKKGESYAMYSLYGPDFQFGVSDNIGVGVLTSWVGTPLIGSVKRSIPIDEKWNAGAGLLLGTGSWAFPDFALALPYGVLSYGDRVGNINFSFGYGGITYKVDDGPTKRRETEGNFLLSVAGIVKVSRSLSLVFDSFIVPRSGTYQVSEYYTSDYDPQTGNYTDIYRNVTKKRYSVVILSPGVRIQTNPNSAFQFGFAGGSVEGEIISFPIPMIQWFRKL
jgi:hypothetical protein